MVGLFLLLNGMLLNMFVQMVDFVAIIVENGIFLVVLNLHMKYLVKECNAVGIMKHPAIQPLAFLQAIENIKKITIFLLQTI